MAARVLILPGYGNSGPAHWQTRWQQRHADFARVQQRDWHHPVSSEWIAALDVAVANAAPGVIVVAHSLACLAVAQWATTLTASGTATAPPSRIAGALLVAPPDPTGTNFPAQALGFNALPHNVLPFPTVVVVSNDDPYDQHHRGTFWATQWGSRLVCLAGAGHINSDSGLGDWPAGFALLAEFGYPGGGV